MILKYDIPFEELRMKLDCDKFETLFFYWKTPSIIITLFYKLHISQFSMYLLLFILYE